MAVQQVMANGGALQGPCSCAVHPSTEPVLSLPKCSGRTACNLPGPLTCTAHSLARLRGNGSALQRACSYAVHPSTGSGRTACNLPGPFLHRSPFARLRGNGSALQGACSYAVHPSTGSGRTVMCCRQRGSLASPNRTVKLRAMGLLECPVTPMLPCAACRACVAPGPVPRPTAVGSNCVRR